VSSFRQIGELCRDVIAEAELRAARQATAAKEVAAQPGGGEAEPPLPSVEVSPRQNRNGKRAGAGKAPASQQGGGQTTGETAAGGSRISSARELHMQPALRLISSKCLDTATTAANGRSPRPVVSRHLVLVSGHAR
jgi:hypothetical protein